MPTVTSKVIITIVFCAICYLIYYSNVQQKAVISTDTSKVTEKDLIKKMKENATSYADFNGIYLYDQKNDQLYIKTPNPYFNSNSPTAENVTNVSYLYYKAGKGVDCPGILNNDSSSWKMNSNSTNAVPSYTLIKGSTAYFSCNNITNSDATDKVKKDLFNKCKLLNSTNAVFPYISSTEDIVKSIEEAMKLQPDGDVIRPPHPNLCVDPGNLSDRSKNANEPTSSKNDIAKFLSENAEMITATVFPLAGGKIASVVEKQGATELAKKIGGVVHVMTMFYMAYTILPGFWNMPSNSWEFQKNMYMGVQVLQDTMEYGLKMLGEGLEVAIAAKTAEAAAAKTGEVALSRLMIGASKYAMVAMKGLVKMFSEVIGFLGGPFASFIQIAGMVVDAVDPCNLNSSSMNLDQKTLDLYRDSYDDALYISSKGTSYPAVFEPSSICDYKLDCSTTYECMSDEDKKANESKYKSSAEYCASTGDSATLNKYMDEYLSSLTVNSSGECIGEITNDVLATYFEMYVGGGYDWSFIKDIKASDVVLPKDKQLKVLELLLANKNVLVASFIDQQKYYVMAVFILVIVIMFVIN
jgi:hypothetical protein